jgi:NAD(P)-dependent dehydrogenase (short-subunit alcohol dehydrogenase family)
MLPRCVISNMANIFITGSANGLGQLAAKKPVELGHGVVLHARNEARGKQALAEVPGAADVLVADLASMTDTKSLASKANALGMFDIVIHNAGVYRVAKNATGAEGLPLILTINTLAPYILTALMHKPKRLIYLSSGMHLQGNPRLDNMNSVQDGLDRISYSDTKLHDLVLAKAVARRWTDVYANAVDPGWVPTKMGGSGAPDNLAKGFQTQVWLAVSSDPDACVSGQYFHHQKQATYQQAADDVEVQEHFLSACAQLTGIDFIF